jgi:hypothetical protein
MVKKKKFPDFMGTERYRIPVTEPYPKSAESILRFEIPLFKDSIQYYPLLYSSASRVVSMSFSEI